MLMEIAQSTHHQENIREEREISKAAELCDHTIHHRWSLFQLIVNANWSSKHSTTVRLQEFGCCWLAVYSLAFR